MFFRKKTVLPHSIFFSLKIVKSLQLRGRRQIVELRKYCLVCYYFSLAYIFLFFYISQIWELHVYSH